MRRRLNITEGRINSIVRKQIRKALMNEAILGKEARFEETFNAISTVLKKMVNATYISFNSALSVIRTILSDPEGRKLVPDERYGWRSVDRFWQSNGKYSTTKEENTGFLWSSYYGEANDFLDNEYNGAVNGGSLLEAQKLYSIIVADIKSLSSYLFLSRNNRDKILNILKTELKSYTTRYYSRR